MKLISFEKDGKASFGLCVDSGIIDAGKVFNGKYDSIRDVLEHDDLAALAALEGNQADYALADITYLPVIPKAQKIYCIGINFMTHINEMKREKPDHPWVFMRTDHCQVGHEQEILRPQVSERFDWEGELAVIIGKTAHRVSKENALSYVAGYSIFNDGSIRDYQRHSQLFTTGKNFYKSGGFGPWMVTVDELPDPTVMSLETRLNGEIMQSATMDDLCFDIPTLISYLSDIAPLCPGDVIVTGTPGGVGFGRDPFVWMKDGDVIEVKVSHIGVLRNYVRNETDEDIVK